MRKIVVLLWVLAACSGVNNRNGAVVVDANTRYLLLAFSDSATKINQADLLSVSCTLYKNDSLYFTSAFFPDNRILVQENNFEIMEFKCIELNHFETGDSVNIFKVSGSDTFNLYLRINESLGAVSAADYFKLHEPELLLAEKKNIGRYIDMLNIEVAPVNNGMYVVMLENYPDHPPVKSGENIAVAYTGRFLNGTVFDSVSAREPLEFSAGSEMQLIKGLEWAIKNMKKGESAKIILPSYLAFGEKGAVNGRVPPYTPVVYEIKILNQ